ncbi:MAG: hypothetical protein WBK97_05605 [Bacteroidales bacterium]|jgi:hypothetical protein
MKRFNRYYIIGGLVLAFLLFPSLIKAQQTIVQESELEKDSILIGDQVWWSMYLPKDIWKERQIETAVFPQPPFDLMPGVEGLSSLRLDSLVRKKRLEGIRAGLLITSFDSGSYRLPDMPLYLKKEDGTTDTLWFKGPELYVNTIPVDTTSFKPFGIKPQMRYPITWGEILSVAGAVFLLMAIVCLLVYIIKRRRKNLPVFADIKPEDPPHTAALKVLHAIKEQELWKKQKAKAYYTLLTDTIRIYLKGRWGIQAMEQTSAEMLAAIHEKRKNDSLLTDEALECLSSMLMTGDLAKFAKYVPADRENEDSLDNAIRFVTLTAYVF